MASGTSFSAGYVRRLVDAELDALTPHLHALLLDGAKGVGKTESALQRTASARRLDTEPDRTIVESEPSVVASDSAPVLIDEWHRVPAVWDAVRRLVDSHSGGPYIMTGSAPSASTHSGAGRIATIRMRPLAFCERGLSEPSVSLDALLRGDRLPIHGRSALGLRNYVDEIVAGGFPGMRGLPRHAQISQLDGYIERIVDHDITEAGALVRRPETLRAWMRAYAAATGTTASWNTIRDAATRGHGSKPAKETAGHYSDLLMRLRILDPLEAWLPTRNPFVRLTGSPKHHLADPALAARLLQRTAAHLVAGREGARAAAIPRDGSLVGKLFESLAALTVRTLAQAAGARTYHLRADGGRHEVDLIVEAADGIVAIEVKIGQTASDHDTRHLRWLAQKLAGELLDQVVITTGLEAYRRPDGVAVVPLALLGP